jgi:hypothetical protein
MALQFAVGSFVSLINIMIHALVAALDAAVVSQRP